MNELGTGLKCLHDHTLRIIDHLKRYPYSLIGLGKGRQYDVLGETLVLLAAASSPVLYLSTHVNDLYKCVKCIKECSDKRPIVVTHEHILSGKRPPLGYDIYLIEYRAFIAIWRQFTVAYYVTNPNYFRSLVISNSCTSRILYDPWILNIFQLNILIFYAQYIHHTRYDHLGFTTDHVLQFHDESMVMVEPLSTLREPLILPPVLTEEHFRLATRRTDRPIGKNSVLQFSKRRKLAYEKSLAYHKADQIHRFISPEELYSPNFLYPKEISAKGRMLVWQRCDDETCGHIEEVEARSFGNSCTACRGEVPSATNNLTVTDPDVVARIDFGRTAIHPTRLMRMMNRTVWVQCEEVEAHIYDVRLADLVKGDGCPYCSGRRRDPNDTLDKYEHISSEYVGNVPVDQILATSLDYQPFKCTDCGSVYNAIVYNRTRKGTGCHQCGRERTSRMQKEYYRKRRQEDLLSDYDVSSEYIGKRPVHEISALSDELLLWRGECGHEWEQTARRRTRPRVKYTDCPICARENRAKWATHISKIWNKAGRPPKGFLDTED